MAKRVLNEDIYSGFLKQSLENLFDGSETDNEYRTNFTSASKSTMPLNKSSRLSRTPFARPSTAVCGAGYTSEAGHSFDPMLNHKTSRRIIVIEKNNQESMEKFNLLERKIETILQESILVSTGPYPNYIVGLNRARRVSSMERTLLRAREKNGAINYHNFDLMYCVLFNLANLYAKNDMYVEAINTFSIMTKNKMFPNVNRLKVNMGNIYLQLGIYSKAIKMYRMALDQVANNQKELRIKITHNIAILFIKMGQYSDAATSFEFIMSERGDIKSGVHLVLCYYAMGEVEKTKKAFKALADIQIYSEEDIKMQNEFEDIQTNQYVLEAINNDELSAYFAKKKKLSEKIILTVAALISPIIGENYNEGYSWCIEVIKSSNFANLANELELNKALVFLRQNNVNQAIETLLSYEKKEPEIAINALINLTFIYLYIGDMSNASKYAKMCRKIDNYSTAAFINSGVCEMMRGKMEISKRYLEVALETDMTSFEAAYNIGLVLKINNEFNDCNSYFKKLKQNLSLVKHPHIFCQLGLVQNNLSARTAALDCFLQMLGISPETLDPGIYKQIAVIYEALNEFSEANQYYSESFRVNPSDVMTASSIGSYYIHLQAAEKAIFYYECAMLAKPSDPYTLLKIATCYHYIYPPNKCLAIFKEIQAQFPENLTCLRALMQFAQSQGMIDVYEKCLNEIQRLERLLQSRDKIVTNSEPIVNSSERKNEDSSYLISLLSSDEDSSKLKI